jgi:hypothetical protein
LLDPAERLAPGAPSIRLRRAALYGHVKACDRALTELDEIERRRAERGLGPLVGW